MAFKPEEVSAILQKELESYQTKLDMDSVGAVLQVGDGIARVWGLREAMAGELLKFPGDVTGLVFNLEEDNVGVVLFGSDQAIKEGDPVHCTGRIAQVPVGPALVGRVVNPLGEPMDGKGPIVTDHYYPLEGRSPTSSSASR